MSEFEDPIVAEVRRYREEHSAKFNHDIQAILADLKERERTSGRTYVRLNPDGTRTYVRYGKVIDPETGLPLEPSEPVQAK